MKNELHHIGIKRRSGRYPWGSGKNPYQSESFKFLSELDSQRDKGMSDKDIAKNMGISTTELRSRITIANKEMKEAKMQYALDKNKEGFSNVEIASDLGISEGSVRNYLKNTNEGNKKKSLDNTVDSLKRGVEKNKYLDVGLGVELQLGISREKLRAAKQRLLDEGYYEHDIYIKQMSDPSKWTTIKVLSKEPDKSVVIKNKDKIRSFEEWTDDGGMTWRGLQSQPTLVKKDRVKINYAEDGGKLKDGLIELKPGVSDLEMGNSKYAQVRVGVEGDLYLKGMAVYGDPKSFPPGVDIIFNTNKTKDVPFDKVLKPMKENRDNPFGATITRQNKSATLNIVNEEGSWHEWSGKVSSQFLAKQPVSLVKERLEDTYKSIHREYEEIQALTNPAVKKHMMTEFANGLDAKARDLKAKGMANTKSHVILPFPDMNPNEVYAPNYKNGDRVVLLRHPHAGRFELPELIVNNNNKQAKSTLKNAIDAIGIHPSMAEKMSGADFDGDSVLVIPNNSGKVKTSKPLSGLKNFDPNIYARDHETITKKYMQIEMGKASNLITDMTVKGATDAEIERAVKHSMVVIDSYNHKLDYKQSKVDNGINALRDKYQSHISPFTGKRSTGASTLLSRAKNEKSVGEELSYEYVDQLTGEIKVKTKRPPKKHQMDMVDDARILSSGSNVENAYADYANKIKGLKNEADKAIVSIPSIKRDPAAAKRYKAEVDSLNEKLNDALLNAPRERQVQIQANKTFHRNLYPDMDKDDIKKLANQSLSGARAKIIPGEEHRKAYVEITDKEWEAIQNGAISQNKLNKILNNTKSEHIKKLATPKKTIELSIAKQTRARMLLDKGYTYADVANDLGITQSQLKEALSIKGGA